MAGLALELIKSRHGPTYKIKISGFVGKIEVSGTTAIYLHGIDHLTPALVCGLILVNRADGFGKPVPVAALRKIEKAVFEKFASIN